METPFGLKRISKKPSSYAIETQLVDKAFNGGYLVSYYSHSKDPYIDLIALDSLQRP